MNGKTLKSSCFQVLNRHLAFEVYVFGSVKNFDADDFVTFAHVQYNVLRYKLVHHRLFRRLEPQVKQIGFAVVIYLHNQDENFP